MCAGRAQFKADAPDQCIQLGALNGGTNKYAHGMFGKATPQGVNVTYQYTYGCTYDFTIQITPRSADGQPSVVQDCDSNCEYSLTWAANTSTPAAHNCLPVLADLCTSAKRASVGNCLVCAGSHQRELEQAGCTNEDFDSFCRS